MQGKGAGFGERKKKTVTQRTQEAERSQSEDRPPKEAERRIGGQDAAGEILHPQTARIQDDKARKGKGPTWPSALPGRRLRRWLVYHLVSPESGDARS